MCTFINMMCVNSYIDYSFTIRGHNNVVVELYVLVLVLHIHMHTACMQV